MVPAFARQLGTRADGTPPATAGPSAANESLATTPHASAVAASSVLTGETPAAGAHAGPADLPVTDGLTKAVVGIRAESDGSATANAASGLKAEVVTPAPTPPAATVEITSGGGQLQPLAGAVAHTVDAAPAIPVTAPAAAVNGASDTTALTDTRASASQPDVAAQIVRHARITIAEGGGRASLRLQPPELGRLDLQITVEKGGIVSMHVISHSQEARILVQAQFAELQSSLQDQGLEVREISVSVRDQRESSERQAEGGPGGSSEGPADSDSLDQGVNPLVVPQLKFFGYGTLDFSA